MQRSNRKGDTGFKFQVTRAKERTGKKKGKSGVTNLKNGYSFAQKKKRGGVFRERSRSET